MKTYVLKLEPYDDIVSIRDKMGWAKNSRILVVLPKNKALLNRRLDMVLLQRHSQTLGCKLALVTRDSCVHYHALRLGIPVFRSLQHTQVQHWRVSRRYRKYQEAAERPSSHRPEGRLAHIITQKPVANAVALKPLTRLVLFSIGVLSVLAIAATLLPSARLILIPRTMVQDVLIDAWTDPGIHSVSLSGAVPSMPITVLVEGRDTQPSSGSIRLPGEPATGFVVFTNLTDHAVKIPKDTIVRTTSKNSQAQRFATTQTGEAPAGPGQIIQIPVINLTPGEQGNLPVGALIAIEGQLGTQLSVVNPEPTSGGSHRLEPIPTSADRQKLLDRLRSALEKTALQEMSDQLNPGDLLLPSSLKLQETLEQNFLPANNLPADQFYLNLRLEYQALVVEAATLRMLAQAVFDANLPVGFSLQEGSLQIETLSPPEPDKMGAIRWQLHALRQVQAQILEAEAIQLSLGLAPIQATAQLEQTLPLEEPPRIEIQPAWWPRLPFLPFRIRIQNLGSEHPESVAIP